MKNKYFIDPLTLREQQVLEMIATGHTDQEISNILNISFSTARRHRENLMLKTGVNKATRLVMFHYMNSAAVANTICENQFSPSNNGQRAANPGPACGRRQ
jgi:DNA-binding CsgD family transcriptional regulator